MNSGLKIQLFQVFWGLPSSSLYSFNSEVPSPKQIILQPFLTFWKGPRAELDVPARHSSVATNTYSYNRILSLQYIEMTFLGF